MLDHLWSETMGLPSDDKEGVLISLVRVLDETQTPYALIGGVAVQLYTSDPRTTGDLDVALRSRDEIPREALKSAGFSYGGTYEWSENWRGPMSLKAPARRRVVVQFSADALMTAAVERAVEAEVGNSFSLQLVTIPDLILLKMAAAGESERREDKRTQDLADVMRLLHEHPELDSDGLRDQIAATSTSIVAQGKRRKPRRD
jgi:hypothetical protein